MRSADASCGEVKYMRNNGVRSITKILAIVMAVIMLAGCTAEDIEDIINSAVDEIVDGTVDEIMNGTGSTGEGPGDEHWGNSGYASSGNTGAGDEHWGNSGYSSSGNTGPGDEHWGTPTNSPAGNTGTGSSTGNVSTGSSDSNPSIELPPPQPGVTVPTLEEDLAGDTYGLLYPKPREEYVGRAYFDVTDEKSFVTVVHEGMYRGIRGIVIKYSTGDYNYWQQLFDRIVNRSEFGGFVKDSFLVTPEENNTMGIYPVFSEAWSALTYYRYKEPEIGDETMKLLKAAHELAEDAMKACPGDERGMLLYINNKICNLTKYADPIPKGLGVPERDATGVFFKGSSVCAGYAVTYRLVLEILGIENCVIVNNKEADDPAFHIWKYVKLDGNWYHVDVTWNDSPSDTARNDYFLLTDEELKKKTEGSSQAYAHEWIPLYTY
jgi:hypothetical protein